MQIRPGQVASVQRRFPYRRVAAYVTSLIAALFSASATRYSTFVGAITDGSGYVSQAARWASGELFGPFAFHSWPSDIPSQFFVPLGYRPGAVPGTDVFIYPPGLPLLFAPVMWMGTEFWIHLVPPLCGGLLIWSTAALAGILAGGKARCLAAALMASSAIALAMATQPMSDVPAAALWMTAFAMTVRATTGGAAAAAGLVLMAVLVRPNLAPAAVIVIGLSLATGSVGRARRAAVITAGATVGVLVLMWIQLVAYGSPFESGHPDIAQLFSPAYITQNLARYPRWYLESHTPLVLAGLAAPLVFWRTSITRERREAVSGRSVAIALLLFAVAIYAAYLPYYPYDDWFFLRFMLPAMGALYAVTAAVIVKGVETRRPALGWSIFVVVVAVGVGHQAWKTSARTIPENTKWTYRISVAAEYLKSMLPRRSVVITFYHSGTVRHYAHASILRPDLIPPPQLDAVVAQLEAGGYRLFVLLDDELERPAFLQRFAGTSVGRLDWLPRARIGTYGRLDLYDLADRHTTDGSWPVDVLK